MTGLGRRPRKEGHIVFGAALVLLAVAVILRGAAFRSRAVDG